MIILQSAKKYLITTKKKLPSIIFLHIFVVSAGKICLCIYTLEQRSLIFFVTGHPKKCKDKFMHFFIYYTALLYNLKKMPLMIPFGWNRLLQSCKSGRAFRVGLGFGPGSGRVRAWLLGKLRAYFGPDTTLTNKLSKNKIVLLPYIYSM